jgi:hypothetical protein
MAAPTITFTGSGSSKTSGTTLAITVTTTDYVVDDCLVVGFSMDPQTGVVSFAQTAGTATVGAFTTEGDVVTGSGTSGIRTVMAWAQVTGAGTITTVTVTHPTATARAAETFNVTGVDVTTPVNCSGAAAGTSESIAGITPTGGGVDVAGLIFRGFEIAAGMTVSAVGGDFNNGATGDWVLGSADSVTLGTTGAGTASNISVAYTVCAPDPAFQIDVSLISATIEENTTTNAAIAAIFQATSGPPLAYLAMGITTGA